MEKLNMKPTMLQDWSNVKAKASGYLARVEPTLTAMRQRLDIIAKDRDVGIYARAYQRDVGAVVAPEGLLADALEFADTVQTLVAGVDDYRAMLTNLTNVQGRCTELLQGVRALVRYETQEAAGALLQVIAGVVAERRRGDELHGTAVAQSILPDGTGDEYLEVRAKKAKRRYERRKDAGRLTWLDILDEEVAEAFAETEPEKLRQELIQVAAVAIKWVEAIDHRAEAPRNPGSGEGVA